MARGAAHASRSKAPPGNGMLSRDANWSVPLLSLPGRAGLDLDLALSYSSMVWTRNGPYIHFDEDNGFPSPRLSPRFSDRAASGLRRADREELVSDDHRQRRRRVELRQVRSSNVYEAGDSSYLVLRATDDTQLSFVEINNEYSCTQVKDRNGNYITITHNGLGRITSIIDTLARVINFNQMPLVIEGGPSDEYEQANRDRAILMAETFQALYDREQAEKLWQAGKRDDAMAILHKNPNVGIEYRALVGGEVVKQGTYFGKDAADFLNGISIAVGAGLLSPLTSASAYSHHADANPQDPDINNPSTINNSGAKNQSCSIAISFSGSYGKLPNGPSVGKMPDGQLAYGIGFSVTISGLSGKIVLRGLEQDSKPKGSWIVEQWVADYVVNNGKVLLQDTRARLDNINRASPKPQVGQLCKLLGPPRAIRECWRILYKQEFLR